MMHRMGWSCLALVIAAVGCGHATRERVVAPGSDRASSHHPVAVVRTSTRQPEGEQTYIPLYADGTASGLIVVNFQDGRLYGTGIPDRWTWVGRDTVEICAGVTVLRNEVGFPPMERDCARHPISGKELDLDGNGTVDLIETFTIVDSLFYRERPRD